MRFLSCLLIRSALGAMISLGLVTSVAHAASTGSEKSKVTTHSLFRSRELWATIDACNPSGHPDTVGIRGSMPGDGHAEEQMFMSFRLQYMDLSTHKWVDVGQGAASGFVQVGNAKIARQAGRSFELKPTTATFTLRGVVSFQWRRGAHVIHSVSRPTSAAHKDVADAEPKGFSSATCAIS